MYREIDEIFYKLCDTDLLDLITVGEAGGEPYEGKVAVMNVIKNRVLKGGWFRDYNIYSKIGRIYPAVILKNALVKGKYIYQFSSFNERDPNRKRLLRLIDNNQFKLTDIAKGVIEGSIEDNTDKALYYYADYIEAPYWAKTMRITTKIGRHIFLKEI